jgi:hypothetical protein
MKIDIRYLILSQYNAECSCTDIGNADYKLENLT